MDMWWNQLEVHCLRSQELLQNAWCFIVQALELQSESSGYKGGMNGCVAMQQFQCQSIF